MRVLMLCGVLMLAGCGKPPCSAADCATGCCDAADVCQAGTQTLACGMGGATCDACTLGESCLQGTCFGGNSGGGSGGTGGGTGGGGVGIRMIPASATVPLNASIELSAELTGAAPDQLIGWSIESGGGSLTSSGPSTATYFAYSAVANVRIRAQANFLSSLATFADFAISTGAQPFLVVPQTLSNRPYVMTPGSMQTFGAVRRSSPSSTYQGLLGGVDWYVWPAGAIANGTITMGNSMTRVYAREQSSNVWSSVGVSGSTTTEPSVAISPALSTVSPNGVVQLTANISSGAMARWTIASTNGGTISTSGTYTAPAAPGVYVVTAQPIGGTGLRFGVATLIVQ